jgi:hypothetical protein
VLGDLAGDTFCCDAYVGSWHVASFRCGANGGTLLEVKRTLRVRQERIDLAKMTHLGHWPRILL